ncbi:MAG: PfkB family carbohydrate kinase [Chloroflexi bacterium]|nr:PfkB family carbohydrate kinase [Chloroflexota bacterium]
MQSLAGGKGCNVAPRPAHARREADGDGVGGWHGGAVYREGTGKKGIATDFVYTDFESRTCTSILDSHNQTMTEIYEKGRASATRKVAEMLVHFREKVNGATAVSLSGSIPPGVPHDIYAQLITIAHESHVSVFLDSSNEALLQGVAAKPLLD